MPQLLHVRPGARFRLAEMPEVSGVLIKATESRAVVRLDRPVQDVEFTDNDGNARRLQSRRAHVTSMASAALVEVIGFETLDDEEDDMSKSKKSGKASAAKAVADTVNAPLAKRAKKAGKKAAGKLSCINAAAKVLADKAESMTTKEMIEAMGAKGLWSSPNGQTPAATL